MKLTKFFPVAVAALALASCTSDELFVEKGVEQQKVKGGLTVTLDEMTFDGQAVTRQGNQAGTGKIVWQNGDKINVYDEDLKVYDEYKFQDTKFVGVNESGVTDIDAPAYALFPADRVDYAGKKKAVMTIPGLIIYDEESEVREGDDLFYVSNLPLWGTATGTYPEATVSMKYLTGAMRINLKNAFADNVTFLKLETKDGQPISGAFEADLSNPADAKLQQGSGSLTTDNVMYVDLRKVPSYLTYLYLPIIARHYDYLKVMTTADGGKEIVANNGKNKDQILAELKAKDATYSWTTIRNWDAGITFTKANGLSLYKETQYDLKNVNTTEELSEALAMYANGISKDDKNPCADGDLVLNIGDVDHPLEVTRASTNYVDDYTIYVPAINPSIRTITINCLGGIKPSATGLDLQIVDKDTKEGYTGKIILNANKIVTTALGAITVNLSETSLTLDGNFGTTPAKVTKFNIKSVNDLTFGNGGTKTTKLSSGSTVTVDKAKSVTIAKNAEVKAALDLVNTIGLESVTIEKEGVHGSSSTNPLKVLDANVFVLGTANYIYQFGSQGTVYIGATGEGQDGKSNGTVSDIYSIGKIYIANAGESEAVSGMISALGNNTITLKQGYVASIGYVRNGDFADPPHKYNWKKLSELTESDRDSKEITLKLDEIYGDGLTAIASIDDFLEYTPDGTNYYNFLKMTESKWGGKVIDKTNFPNYVSSSALTKVYTASELASADNLTAGDKILLYNDIDLNGKAWTCPSLKGAVDGQDPRSANAKEHASRINGETQNDVKNVHVIKNLKLDNATAGTLTLDRKKNFGLFGRMGNSSDVKNIKIEGVTSNLNKAGDGTVPSNIGAVIGSTDGAVTLSIDNVVVKSAALGANLKKGDEPGITGVQNVGGLVGYVASTNTSVKIQNSAVDGGAITGQGYLGGAIGKYEGGAGTVLIEKSKFGQNFTVAPLLTCPDYGSEVYGTVGMMIGQVNSTSATEIKLLPETGQADNIANNRETLGFKWNYTYESGIKYGFYGGNSYVGYSPNFTDEKLIVKDSSGETKYMKTLSYIVDMPAFNGYHKSLKQNAYIQWSNWGE